MNYSSILFASALAFPANAAKIAGGIGGFEMNNAASVTPVAAGYWFADQVAIPGWSFNSTARWFQSSAAAYGKTRSGSYALDLCNAGNACTATAQITGLVSGSSYRVSFFASRRNVTASSDSFTAGIDTGGSPTSRNFAAANLPAGGGGDRDVNYTLQTLDFSATATTHNLGLAANSDFGFMLDDFSIDEIVPTYVPPGTLADYNEVWTTPNACSWESMPLGKGETSVNVWVEGNGDLLFTSPARTPKPNPDVDWLA